MSVNLTILALLAKDDDIGSGLMANMLGMISLFLRLDLLENFREKDFLCGPRNTLLYLLDASLLFFLNRQNLKRKSDWFWRPPMV